jgi:membrane protease YdiL (CAAX protease family)
MVIAGGLVAAVAIPFGIITAAIVLRRRLSLLPRWKPWRVPWGGLQVLIVFLVVVVAVPLSLLKSGLVPEKEVSLIAFPIQVAILICGWRLFYPHWRPFRRDATVFRVEPTALAEPIPIGAAFARAMTLAIMAWAIITPVVFVVHGLVNWTFLRFGLTPEQHPLTSLGLGEAREQVSLLLQACLVAPILEELVFRGILLPWMVGGRERYAFGVPTETSTFGAASVRPLVVMACGVLYAGASGKTGPVIFAGILSVGLAIAWVLVRRGRRHFRAVYVSAAFFGLIHSAVWPSPVPLFFLGLGLGWLAVRTRGILVPIVVHGLFNAVSAIYILRGAS